MLLKNAVITGVFGDIGTSIAKQLIDDGYFVVGIIRPKTLHRAKVWLRDQLQRDSKCIHLVEVDVSDYDTTILAASKIIEAHGPISVLVNNAGITRDATVKKMGINQWHEVLSTNLTGYFNMIKSVFADMTNNGYGRIVNISSINAHKGQFGQANYAAAKAGVLGLTKSVALEGAKKGVTCNSISPGYVRTNMTAKLSQNILDSICNEIPIGRMAEPKEVAQGVLYLVHPNSGFITGADLSINGGHHLR